MGTFASGLPYIHRTSHERASDRETKEGGLEQSGPAFSIKSARKCPILDGANQRDLQSHEILHVISVDNHGRVRVTGRPSFPLFLQVRGTCLRSLSSSLHLLCLSLSPVPHRVFTEDRSFRVSTVSLGVEKFRLHGPSTIFCFICAGLISVLWPVHESLVVIMLDRFRFSRLVVTN